MSERGRILTASRDGTFLLRFAGDVRVTLCVAMHDLLQRMFDEGEYTAVVVDLSQATGLDSTALGLLAKLAQETRARLGTRPWLIRGSGEVMHGLISLGIDDLFEQTEPAPDDGTQVHAVPLQTAEDPLDEDETRQRVLEAHRVLMALKPENHDTFKDLVAKLEALDDSLPGAAPLNR